jgi:parallel beta-helix repeat protein
MALTYRLIRNRSVVAQNVTTTSHVDSPVAPATKYSYAVKSCDASGCSAPSGPVTTPSGHGGAPATPSGFTAVASDTAHVTLGWKSTWKASTYRVFRNGNIFATVSATTFVDDTVAPKSTHSYAVAACSSKCSAPTSSISVTTPGQPTPEPSGVTAGITGPGEVTVSWTAFSGATSYTVYRNGVPIATTTAPSYVDSGLAPSTLYFYMVSACASTGCSLPSAAAVVKTPGSPPACSGVSVDPGSDLQAIVKSYPGGTTFCVKAGTYAVTGTGVLLKSYDTVIGEPGAVLDGGGVAQYGLYGYGTSTGQKNVTIKGLTLKNFAGRAIRAGWDWTIQGNEMSTSQVGVALNSGVVLRGNYIHDNRQYGISSGPASNILIEGNELAHNNTSISCGGSCAGNAGGSKIVGSTPGTYGVTWRGNWVHDNIGPGIWSDGNVHNVLYENNLVQDNTGIGIFHEISWAGTIRNNVVRDNDSKAIGKSCWWASAQIDVNNSQNVQVYGNTVSSSDGANGICGYGGARSETAPYPTSLANLDVHDNNIHLVGAGLTGEAGVNASNISFDTNMYYVDNLSTDHWIWRDTGAKTWSQFQSVPQETHGTLKPDH